VVFIDNSRSGSFLALVQHLRIMELKMRKVNNGKRRSEERRTEANMRLKERSGRNKQQQLALLDKRLGKGVGAKRERERLNNANTK
jgi:hypothetical protein